MDKRAPDRRNANVSKAKTMLFKTFSKTLTLPEKKIKFGVYEFKEIRKRLESFRMMNIPFFFAAICEERECVNFSLYMETKILVRLNIFD